MTYTKKSIIVKVSIVILAVVCSILNGYLQMNRKANKVENIFMVGENEDNLSIHYDLTKIDDSMFYLISLAHANQQDNQQDIKKLESLHKQFSAINTIEEYHQWYQETKEVYPLAVSYLKSINMSQEHQDMLSKYEATYKSSTHTIAYSSYNQYVYEYENETDGVIARFIKKITGVKKVKSFD